VKFPFRFPLLLFLLACSLSAEVLTTQEIEIRLVALDQASGNGENETVQALWREALKSAKDAELALATAKQHHERTARLSALTTLSLPESSGVEAPLAEQVAFQDAVNAAIETSKARKAELETESLVSRARITSLGEELAKTKAELVDLEISATGASELEQANYQREIQRQVFLNAKVVEIQAEQGLIKKRTETITDRISRRDDQMASLKKMLTEVTKVMGDLRSQETKSTSDSLAKFEAKAGALPELGRLLEMIRDLNDRRTGEEGVDSQLAEAVRYFDDIEKTKIRIADQSKNARERIRLLEEADLGVDTETGLQLRTQRSRLPGISEMTAEYRKHVAMAAQSQIEQLELQDRQALTILSNDEIQEISRKEPTIKREDLEGLLNQRREILSQLVSDHQTLNTQLSEATAMAKLTMVDIADYSHFLDQRLLWIKSTRPLTGMEPVEEWGRIIGLFTPSVLGEAWMSVQQNWFPNLIPMILLSLIFLFTLVRRKKFLDWLKAASEEAARRNCTRIVPTLKTMACSVALASCLPSFIFLGVYLLESPEAYRNGLVNMGFFILIIATLSRFSRKDGLFEAHFKIATEKTSLLQRSLAWLIPVGAPLSFLMGALIEPESNQAGGRISFMVAMVIVAWFGHRVLHPSRSILKRGKEDSVVVRGGYFLFLAIPLIFGIGAGLGYFASVLTLRTQVTATMWLMVLAFLLVQFFNRWILVSKRRLAIAQALRRREAILAERERAAAVADAVVGAEKVTDLPSLDEVKANAVNVVEVEVQTTQLLRLSVFVALFFALWGVWFSTLPALTVFDKITIWGGAVAAPAEPPKTSIPGMAMLASKPKDEVKGGDDSASEEDPQADTGLAAKVPEGAPIADNRVSLQDVFLAILMIAITFIAARNIPSLLSLTLFNRINLGPGGNFALTTTARYLIVLIGVVLAFNQIEITWGKVQWLAAAITLGIGFGLQEIFANFVAGIIMLFERPIRLGDVVTVGDVSGKVTQINIRATTIQQFNNRELLVPNKEFITSQLVNWTLRDTVLRFEVVVGIAYGSDTRKAAEILKGILDHHPKVIAEPKPDVLFTAFGASTLDFTARGFVGNVEDLVSGKSDIHYLIDDAFREAGIEIAFPQQDIHIRSITEQITRLEKS